MTVDQALLDDAQKLTADGMVELYEIELNPTGMLFLKIEDEVEWQGRTYEAIGIQMTGTQRSVDGEQSRPKLHVSNPEGRFSALTKTGVLEKALVHRKRVLRKHLDEDTNIFLQQTWYISRVAEITSERISCELRSLSDGQFFTVPSRVFMPPEFPTVTL